MHILLIFLDGIGLGDDHPTANPFAVAHTPTLHALAGGHRWLRSTPRLDAADWHSLFIPTDARLGVPGRPQSASGQAAIMTGRNVPREIGEHYGPRPNPAIRAILDETNVYKALAAMGKSGALLDAYPPGFFQAVERGKRRLSALQHAAHSAGVPIRDKEAYYAGRALSPDWTGDGWHSHLGFPDAPRYTPAQAAVLMADLAREHHFSLFSTWITDEIGHRGPFADAVAYLELFDQIMAALLTFWDMAHDLIIITSDHGNMEDLSIRQHTENDVPTVVIGAGRHTFAEGFAALTDITPGVIRVLGG
jgi:hypothetical protein